MQQMMIEKIGRKFCIVQINDNDKQIVESYKRMCDARNALAHLRKGAFEGPVPSFMLLKR